MYFISAATTILFQVLFGVIDILDLGYTWKICPLIVICGQVTFKKLGGVQYVKSQLSTEHTAKLSVIEVVRRVAEVGSLSLGAKMAMKIFVKRVFTIFTTNASFFNELVAKTFRICKNFPVSIADALTGFL